MVSFSENILFQSVIFVLVYISFVCLINYYEHILRSFLEEACFGVNLVEACTRLLYCFNIVGNISTNYRHLFQKQFF